MIRKLVVAVLNKPRKRFFPIYLLLIALCYTISGAEK
jgi:hypothetical protein